MSHLGDRISALIDGELTGTELDRANSHLASCDQCRIEAAALRALKRELGALAAAPAAPAETATLRRLMAVAGPGGPIPPRRPVSPVPPGGRSAGRRDRRGKRRPRRGYAVAGAVGIAVVGIGAAAFTVGGGTEEQGPRITPPIQAYTIENAITTGDVPIPEPSSGGSAASSRP